MLSLMPKKRMPRLVRIGIGLIILTIGVTLFKRWIFILVLQFMPNTYGSLNTLDILDYPLRTLTSWIFISGLVLTVIGLIRNHREKINLPSNPAASTSPVSLAAKPPAKRAALTTLSVISLLLAVPMTLFTLFAAAFGSDSGPSFFDSLLFLSVFTILPGTVACVIVSHMRRSMRWAWAGLAISVLPILLLIVGGVVGVFWSALVGAPYNP